MGVDVTREICARIGSARQAFEEMKRPIFLNKRFAYTSEDATLSESHHVKALVWMCSLE